MRPLMLFIIGIVFGTAGGFLLSGGLEASGMGHDHADHDEAAAHDHASHDHAALAEWPANIDAPQIALTAWPDGGGAVNLRIDAPGFAFTPEEVNGENSPGTGHAHVYVDGVKVARVYGAYVHLPEVPTGSVIRVTLNANDHSEWAIAGAPLAHETIAP